MDNNIINLVNKLGERIGKINKLEAHIDGKLHEAFSIFIFNTKKELLIQQRAREKYHSGGLWSNTVCSHPNFNEEIELTVHRRLNEEMGFDCKLKEVFSFLYKAEHLANNLIENEFDHVFIGHINKIKIKPNLNEICDYKWVSLDNLRRDIKTNPKRYTERFKIILNSKEFQKQTK